MVVARSGVAASSEPMTLASQDARSITSGLPSISRPAPFCVGAPAVRALVVGDLVCGAASPRARRDRAAAEGLDEVGVADLGAAFGGDDRARLPPQRLDLGRQLDAHHARE